MPATKVLAEINAIVAKIDTAVGNRVSEGDTIILLESMKMEIPVFAPCDGRVAAILVSEQDVVSEGQLLATIEP
jgi:biotin carboxyl carrier protein